MQDTNSQGTPEEYEEEHSSHSDNGYVLYIKALPPVFTLHYISHTRAA